ncbi:hypothetical protein SAMN05443287_107210 [Micromonospora phaseoli]|uniref:Uncharacterized protein n=1 Tax=Micromonospora phaseoli TaxID=1144548 RepID=A0A1H7BHQ6_9ACTN|nr:hypothetical protein [Micromonospora phaseoli]PZV95014.1 hypothetical protein CLV64_108152 [Micromonospora phaseoli]GIJ79561.1 hypothetical protein Xph01_39930 [Micromonospora phaseoli]SEJ75857.1 hypothetical protein SAMN05443287_107210 [Micromonospora phaseoli]
MARQGWGGSIATAAGVAAGAGAAQLGFGYGLGILNWAPTETTVGTAAWVASLIWATWIAATSTIFGAVCAQRLHDRRQAASPSDTAAAASGSAASGGPVSPVDEAPSTTTTRQAGGGLWGVALAVAAGLGALITVLLVAVPARVAVVPDTPSPRNMAAGYAAVGVLVGTLVAVWALRCRAAATNVVATAGWLWLLAVIAVVDSVLAGRGLTTAQLGIWQLSSDSEQFWIRDYFYWPGAVLSLGSALVIGALAARSGVRATDRRVGATASGAAGPLLVAIAYFLAVPRLTAISPEQVSAHLTAPYAVIVGIGGSVLVAALAQRSARLAESRSSNPGPSTVVPRQRVGDDDRLAHESEPDTDRLDGTAAGESTVARSGTTPRSTAPRSTASKQAAPKQAAPGSAAPETAAKPEGSAEGSTAAGEDAGTSLSVESSGGDETPEGGSRRVRQQRRGR